MGNLCSAHNYVVPLVFAVDRILDIQLGHYKTIIIIKKLNQAVSLEYFNVASQKSYSCMLSKFSVP